MFSPEPSPTPEAAGKAWGIAVRGIVFDPAGRVLLLRRAATSRHFPGEWEFPGGKLDAGETLDQAVCREVREETRLETAVTGLLGATEVEVPEVRVASLFFSLRPIAGSLRLSSEHDQSSWVKPAEMTAYQLAPTVRDFAAQLASIRAAPRKQTDPPAAERSFASGGSILPQP